MAGPLLAHGHFIAVTIDTVVGLTVNEDAAAQIVELKEQEVLKFVIAADIIRESDGALYEYSVAAVEQYCGIEGLVLGQIFVIAGGIIDG